MEPRRTPNPDRIRTLGRDGGPDTRYRPPEAVQHDDQGRDERLDAALEAARRPDPRHLAHEEAQIEAAGPHQKALRDVGMPSQIHPTHAPRLVEMGVRALQPFAALSQQAFPSGTPNPTPVAMHSRARQRLALPAASPAIRLRHVAAKPEVGQRDHRLVAVVALVADDLGDTATGRQHRFDLLGRGHQRLDHGRRVARVGVLDGHADDRVRLQVHRVLRLSGRGRGRVTNRSYLRTCCPNLDRIRLAQLTPQDVAEGLRRVKVSGNAYMARGARDVLRTALNQALRWELVSRNVAALADPPRHRTREITPLTPRQAGTLLEAVAGHRLEALITVALGLGLRQGEALGLRWEEDVDLEAGTLSVQQTLVRAGREPRFEEPKTDRSCRTITMPGVVAAALRRHRTRQLEEQLAAGPEWHPSGLVFTTPIGTPIDRGRLHGTFKAILRSAGLPDIRYHDLRHTAATLLLVQGVDLRTIMATLGHSRISQTMDLYAHMMPTLRGHAAEQMNAILAPKADG